MPQHAPRVLFTTTLLILLSFSSLILSAQQMIDGNVLDKKSNLPIPNASISLSHKRTGITTDASGRFSIQAAGLKQTDTLVFSSVGYSPIRVPVAKAVSMKSFFLSAESKQLENVVVKTYKNEAADGSISEKTGYFRSWTTNKGGGEIGRIIYVRSDDYKVERVRFKTNNQCDTCIIRLHIRGLRNGLPDEDLLRDSISIVIGKAGFDDRFAEFDLRDKNIIIKKNKYVFVSLETLRCNTKTGTSCSLCYIGTEEGNFLYRTKDYREWEESTAHSLYLRMFYKF